jgi:hypothetical protein
VHSNERDTEVVQATEEEADTSTPQRKRKRKGR